ncbi:hypothetical protein [Nocardioides sp. AX2bis]|uniref:hypothetical protein n=1 Tax=Nocardioides sp. AX2bis TaxID=2653157 RepID=UPI0012F0F0B7|nr:hypothetical protein [Nocardioides sp. AX2bis]VXC32731.1 conserved exported hypothetical protein [Nocardioides sp. AX2bis]
MTTTPAPRRTRRTASAAAAIALTTLSLLAPASQAAARNGGGEGETEGGGSKVAAGNYAVTVNGRTYDPAPGKDLRLDKVATTTPITVSGRNTSFTIDPTTLGVYDYTLTGASAPDRMVTRPTVVFASKVPVLTAAQRRSPSLTRLEVRDGSLVAILGVAGGKLKVQAKDAPQGGIFQMEPEFGSDVEVVHTLGPELFYFVNPYTSKINFGDGTPAVTTGDGAHQMLLGKDSPQVATKLAQTATTTRWSVASGGRMGGVLGEDAVELSQGATSCTSQCQAQNRIRGSVPVPPDPTDPTPLP